MPLRKVLAQHTLEGAGFEVHRAFPTTALPMVDPFLLLDQMGPMDLGPGEAKGAPDHPHRGFETVTYMLEGEFEHKDSHGHVGRLRPGDVQWMTAGSGVVHSEMPSRALFDKGGRMHGVQLWINLPARDKMMPPRYQEIPSERIPEVRVDGGSVKVVAGSFEGMQARIDTRTPIEYLHIRLRGGARLGHRRPEGHNGFLHVLAGQGAIDDTTLATHEAVVLPGTPVTITAGPEGLDALWISGVPLGEPVARWGPFVMNTQAELQQAMRDYQEGRMGEIAHGEGPIFVVAADPSPFVAAIGDRASVTAIAPEDAEGAIRGQPGVVLLGADVDTSTANRIRKLATSTGVRVVDVEDGDDALRFVQEG